MEKSRLKSIPIHEVNLLSNLTIDHYSSHQTISLSNPASPDQVYSRSTMMNSLFSPQPARRQTTNMQIQRPVPTFPGYHLQVPGSSTSGTYSAFAPFNSGGTGHSGSATLGYEDPAVTAARRANWNRIRQHRSLDGESLQLLNDANYYQNESIPPADPQVPSQAYSLHSTHHLSQSPRFHSQGNLMVGGGSGLSNNQQIGTSSGPFSNALLAGLSGLNLEQPVQNMASQYQSHNPHSLIYANSASAGEQALVMNPTLTGRDPYSMSLPVLQREYEVLRREYESSMQKLNSTMNSIKTFWSPELKKERGMRKDEVTKFTLLQEQLKMGNQETQKQASLIHQLQDELHCQYELSRTIRNTEIQSVPREEYEATRLERDRLHRELLLSKDTMRELELQVETQRQTLVSRDDSVKKLLDMLQSKGLIPYGAVQDRLDLETAKSRLIELEKRCLHYESLVHQKDQDVRMLQDECLNASEKIKQMQMQYDRFQRLPIDNRESGALHTLLETKVARIEQLEQRIALYEDEINRLRDQRLQTSRNYADKTLSEQQYNEIKHKADKAEMELAQKQSELQAMQTRLSTAEEQSNEYKKHVELVKQSNTTKDHQINSLQTDIESLRNKLENRTETIEHKTRDMQQLQHERSRLQTEVIDLNEQLKTKDGKITSLQRKLENCEEVLKEKDRQQDMFKQRLNASPQLMQQKQIQDQIDELMRERERLLLQVREQRDRMETERMDELDSHRREVRDLRMAIESLQKEITDRQILIESQNEKISDVNRDLGSVKIENKRLAERSGELFEASKEIERLNKDLQDARIEVERLLKIVQAMEKEKESINLQIKELEKHVEESKTKFGGLQQTSSLERKTLVDSAEEAKKKSSEIQNLLQQKESRIEELEEALKESCSITAERELLVAQQKQHSQVLDAKVNAYKDQITKNQKQYEELNTKMTALQLDKQEKDNLVKSLKHERRKHLEEVLQLKEEALLAAISEKDAHIALLETSSNRNPDEVETLRKHKEKLMKRLKEENARRVKLLTEYKDGDLTTPLVKEMKTSPNDQIIQVVRYIELQKKKLRVFIDQLLSCILDIDPELLIGLPRTQQSQGVDVKLLKKLTHDQLIIELQQRETDSLTLQHYANSLLQRMSRVQPTLVRRAIKLLDSFNGALMQTSPVTETHSFDWPSSLAIGRDTILVIGKTASTTAMQNSHRAMALQYSLKHHSTLPSTLGNTHSTTIVSASTAPPAVVIRPPVSPNSGIEC